jgi:phosphatidylinositol alpha-1,6-mannosyltransferase
MKVLVLATDIFSRSGIARYTSALAQSLGSMLGPENVDVLCFFSWGPPNNDARGFRLMGMVSGRRRAGSFSRLLFLLKAARAGFRRYDLVIANHVALAPVARMLNLIFRIPYWVSCHSVEIWWGTSRMRRAALRRADLILPVSQYTAEVIRKIEGIESSRVKVLYNAIPDSFDRALRSRELERTGAGKRTACLLSVCNLVRGNEFKGVDTVIRALPAVLKVFPDLRYVVVGEGEIREKLQRLAAESGVGASVVFRGEVSDEELVREYRDCDVFVLPSRGQQQGGVGGEGFGRVYVEAALAGKPVVGSRTGGAAEAVVHGKTGFLVDPASTGEVSKAVLDILQDPELATRLGSDGRKWALDTFSEEALGRSLRALLRPYGFENEGVHALAHAGGQL